MHYVVSQNQLQYQNFPHTAFVGEVISEEYVLEYGTDCLEMHVGAVQRGERALVIDDLVATGGTLSAAISLLGEFQTFSWDFSFSILMCWYVTCNQIM